MSFAEFPSLQTVASFDGAEIAYRDFGGSGPGLLLLPGWACIQTMWDAAIPFLSPHGRVVSLDFAGFGASTGGDRSWTMQNFARDAQAVIQRLDLQEVTVVGHSMGGAVALEVAVLCQDRVAAVIGCDTFTYTELYRRVDDAMVASALTAYRTDYPTTVRKVIGAYLLKTGDASLATYVADVMAAARPDCAIPAMENLLQWDLDESLAKCPVRVSAINAKPFLKSEAEAMYRDRIAIRTIDDVGHFLMMEQPQAVAAAVLQIVEETATRHRPLNDPSY